MKKINLSSLIAKPFHKTFSSKKTNQIDKGGRGSTKTSKNALKIIYHCLSEKNCNAVILRKYQNTLRGSVFKEIKKACTRFGMIEGVDYNSSLAPLEIRLNNRNTIYFAGGDDYEKIKGMIDEKAPIKIVWFEELTEFDDEEDIDQIKATFSRGNDDWFITLYTFNPPKNKFNWVNKWTESMSLREDTVVTHTTYLEIPEEWLGKEFLKIANNLKKLDFNRYRWIYLGDVIGIEGLICNPELVEYVPQNILKLDFNDISNIKPRIMTIDLAIDCGHQTSASTYLAIGKATDGFFYLLDTYYYSPNEKVNKKAPSELSRDLFRFKAEVIRTYKGIIESEVIDSAEGALRNQYYRDYGIKLQPVSKLSKEDMIDYYQNFLGKRKLRVLDIPNNQIFKKELENYSWKNGSVENGRPVPDKTEKRFNANETYFSTYTNDYSFTYAEHTQDAMQYWIVMNKRKVGL